MKRYQDWAGREYSTRQRIILLAFAGVFFVLILPYLLINSSTKIDARLQLPQFDAGVLNVMVGLLLVIAGGFLALWSIEAQISVGKGTPVPVMPTQKLVVKAPFTYCRNPMTFGTIIAYGGIGVWIGSFSAIAIVLILACILLLYIKYVEEKELEARFGAEYLEYKRYTPFMLPRLRLRS